MTDDIPFSFTTENSPRYTKLEIVELNRILTHRFSLLYDARRNRKRNNHNDLVATAARFVKADYRQGRCSIPTHLYDEDGRIHPILYIRDIRTFWTYNMLRNGREPDEAVALVDILGCHGLIVRMGKTYQIVQRDWSVSHQDIPSDLTSIEWGISRPIAW